MTNQTSEHSVVIVDGGSGGGGSGGADGGDGSGGSGCGGEAVETVILDTHGWPYFAGVVHCY